MLLSKTFFIFAKKTMQIIPAIDLIDGKCVRLTQGDYSQKTIYNQNPVEVAKTFAEAGLQRLHLVDLDGAKIGKVVNIKVLEEIAKQTKLQIDFGGGIKTEEDLQKIFDFGATWASIGSIAAKNQALFLEWLAKFGAKNILLGADVRNENIAVGGWTETTNLHIIDFLRTYTSAGVNQVFCTDISKDGKLQGISVDLYKKILHNFPDLHLIASGGVSNLQDLEQAKSIGCSGVIVGKAFYENRISLAELANF
jgi:phosphoribosylformimino-5-aminoimidazole carboxamide ribotide isomerase